METKHIENWIKICRNPQTNHEEYRECKERLNMVNVKDYYKACRNLSVTPFEE